MEADRIALAIFCSFNDALRLLQAITRSSPIPVDHRSGICLDLSESVRLDETYNDYARTNGFK
jgi:hypothetical protein